MVERKSMKQSYLLITFREVNSKFKLPTKHYMLIESLIIEYLL